MGYPFYSYLCIVKTGKIPRKFTVTRSTETVDDASIITMNNDIRSKLLTVIRTCQLFHFSIKVITIIVDFQKVIEKGVVYIR